MASKKAKTQRGGRTGAHRYPISLVMIVRDETATLGRCLESVQGLVDEIVVVDTGSIDDTVAIAESYGAHVGHFTWIDDFAAAKNYALSLATHPWRLVLDADEWIANREVAAVELDRMRGLLPTFVGRIGMHQVDEETGELRDDMPFPLPRLLPRQTVFRGRVHEQVAGNLPMYDTDILLGHDGYTREANVRKDGRNIALLEAELTENPDNPYYWFQLGVDHYAHRRYEPALPYLVQAYNLLHPEDPAAPRPEFAPWWHLVTVKLMLTLSMLEMYDQAVALGEQEAETWIGSSEFFYVFGTAARQYSKQLLSTDKPKADSMITAAIGCWKHAVEQGDHRDYAGALNGRGSIHAAKALVRAYDALGRTADAAKYRAYIESVEGSAADPADAADAGALVAASA